MSVRLPDAPDQDEFTRARADLAARVADATRLGLLGSPLRRMTDIQSALDEVLRTVTALLDAKSGVLMLYDPERDELFPRASLGVPEDYLDVLTPVRRPIGAVGTGLATIEPLVMSDVRLSPLAKAYADAAEAVGIRAIYSAPLLTLGDELMGTIAVFFPEPHEPSNREIELVEAYARQAAEMVERARMHGEARQLAALERRRTAQLRLLAEATLAISSSADFAELLQLVTDNARIAIGAHAAVGIRLDGESGERQTYVSLSEFAGPAGDALAAFDLEPVLAVNTPVRLPGEELRRRADLRGHSPAALRAYLAAPLVARDARNLGVVELANKIDGTDFTPDDEAVLVQLAQMASVAIENLELVERERAARQEAESLARMRGLLADASRRFAASLEFDETLRAVVDVAVPALADWSAVHLVDDDDRPRVAYVHHHQRDRDQLLRELFEDYPMTLHGQFGSGAVIRTGVPRVITEVTDDLLRSIARDETQLERLRALPLRSRVTVPLTARGRTFGALSFGRDSGDAFSEDEQTLVRELADRAATALDNASRFAFERQLAVTLQRSLLPQGLPVTPALESACRYLPGASGTRIGGDWYDVIALDDGRIAMVVGDVMGQGVTAAAVMGQLRAAVRAYALDGGSPASLLQRLDRVVQSLGEAHLTTCIFALYDPADGGLCVSAAGHLPPLVVPPGGAARFLDLDPGLPLGVGGGGYVESSMAVEPGTLLLLYTDGLVEGRDCAIDDGLAALRSAVDVAPAALDDLCDHVLRSLGRDGDHDDDTALLAVRFHGVVHGTQEFPSLELAPAPESVAAARAFVVGRLAGSLPGEVVETVQLLVSELVTNAVRHARTSLTVRLAELPSCIRVDVTDGDPDAPTRPAGMDEEAESGRGMLLVEALSDRWGVDPLLAGKRVWFELDR